MKIQSRLDQKEIVVEIQQNTNYGIMLSGGFDSAVLLYFVLAEFKNKKLPIKLQPFTVQKFDGSYKYVDGVIEYFNTMFDIQLPNSIIVGDPSLHHSQQNKSGVLEIFSNHKSIDKVFIGLNQNPPEPFGDPKWEKPNRPSQSTDHRIILPFIELYKTHIVDLIFQYNLQYLMNITHTCTEQPIGRCGICFQCSERAWAFTQLKEVDTGIL